LNKIQIFNDIFFSSGYFIKKEGVCSGSSEQTVERRFEVTRSEKGRTPIEIRSGEISFLYPIEI
jgi:hypothetical protein